MSTSDGKAAGLAEYPGAYAVASADPGRIAIITPGAGQRMTFGELGAAANQIAHGLRALGLRRGDRVAGLMRNSAEHFEVLLATFQTGLYVVPVNTRLAPGEVAYIVRDSGAKAMIAADALARALEPVIADLPEARFAVGEEVPGWRRYAELRDDQPSHPPGAGRSCTGCAPSGSPAARCCTPCATRTRPASAPCRPASPHPCCPGRR